MKNSTISLIAALGIFVLLKYASAAEEMSCKEFVGGLTKRQLAGIQECNKKLGLKTSKDKKEKMNCVFKCLMVKEKLLNAEGLFDDSFDAFLANEVPPGLMDKAKPMFMNCVETAGKQLDSKEANCKSYDPLIKCMLGVIGELCK